jgi:hypothetical protein
MRRAGGDPMLDLVEAEQIDCAPNIIGRAPFANMRLEAVRLWRETQSVSVAKFKRFYEVDLHSAI